MVNIVGDSVLAEFDSAIAAVATAIDIQERMAHFNGMLDEERRLMFRIGVHLGEVIIDDETQAIFGDGVNVAARIQAMAEPGGIAVSRAVRDVTELQVEYAFVDGGEHQAKNVSRSLQIYHVQPRTGASTRTTTSVVPRLDAAFPRHAGRPPVRLRSRHRPADGAPRRPGDRPRARPERLRAEPLDGLAPSCAPAVRRRQAAGRGPRFDQRHGG